MRQNTRFPGSATPYLVLIDLLSGGCTVAPTAADLGDARSGIDMSMAIDSGFCSCAFEIGAACTTPGESCLCAERGSRVCQNNHIWELILDVGHCPANDSGKGYEGLGCLGAAPSCSQPSDAGVIACTCDPGPAVYVCGNRDLRAKIDGN